MSSKSVAQIFKTYFKMEILMFLSFVVSFLVDIFNQGFGREKDGNRGKFIGSNLVIFYYKEFEKFALCKSISQSEVIFIVYS